MLIIICTLCIAIVAVVMICCYHLLCNIVDKQGKSKKEYPHWLQWISFILFISSMLLLFMEGMIILKKRLPYNQRRTEIYYQTRYKCIQRVLSIEEVPPYDVVKEIIAYNSEIQIEQYYANSYWTNWFASPIIVNQPLIKWREKEVFEQNVEYEYL